MGLYVLDTDTFSHLIDGHPEICRRVTQTRKSDIAITIVTVEESLTGWYTQVRRARKDDAVVRAFEALRRSVEALRGIRILGFDERAAALARDMRSRDRRIGTNDLRIAAITMANAGTLVTCNVQDFSGFSELHTDDWSNPQLPPDE